VLELQPHFLLHRRAYSNTSLLVELLSLEGARYPALAKGARSGRALGAALLQPFRPLLVAVTGTGEVMTVSKLDVAGPALSLRGEALYCGFYVNELVMRLLGRNDPHEDLFRLYQEVLIRLSEDSDIQQGLRRFELGLLQVLGYGMVLEREALSAAPVQPQRRYRYRIESGPEPAAADAPEQETLSGATLLALAQGQPLDPPGMREARGLMRRVLDHYLGGRPLKSRELFARDVCRPGSGTDAR
jgi:DNA repair protein RecO (recombination protein O)